MDMLCKIQSLLAQTLELRKLVEADGDESLARLEALLRSRQISLESFFSKPAAKESEAAVREMIETILTVDAESTRLLEMKKRAIGEQLGRMHQGKQAVLMYDENDRL